MKKCVLLREIKLENLDHSHVLCYELCVFRNVLSIMLTNIKYAVYNRSLSTVAIQFVSYFKGLCINFLFCLECISVWNVHYAGFLSHILIVCMIVCFFANKNIQQQ